MVLVLGIGIGKRLSRYWYWVLGIGKTVLQVLVLVLGIAKNAAEYCLHMSVPIHAICSHLFQSFILKTNSSTLTPVFQKSCRIQDSTLIANYHFYIL